MNSIEVGRVVESLAGRDAGRLLVVLRVDGEYAYVADGDLRKSKTPKKKKCKHLLPKKDLLNDLQDSINNGRIDLDAQLRKHVKQIEEQGAVNTWLKTM